MRDRLVLVTDPGDARAVRVAAESLARALQLELREAPMSSYDERCSDRVLAALEADDVAVAVVPYSDGHLAHVVNDVIGRCRTPVLIVPLRAGPVLPTTGFSRVLVPLEGTTTSAEGVADAVSRFSARGADIIVLHVFDRSTIPPMWDQPAHAGRSWADEFRARFCDQPDARVELRTGVPGEQILDVARAEQADLIALAWSQHLSPGHARTVRTMLAASPIPVLLLPDLPPDTAAEPASAGAAGRA